MRYVFNSFVKTKCYILLLILFIVFFGVLTGFPQGLLPAARAAAEAGAAKTVVYYFHGNRRCATCRGIEANTRRVVDREFNDLLARGRIGFESVNLDQSENEHFVTDFKLVSRTVVLTREVDGRVVKFKTLDRIWQLAHQPEKLRAYLKEEIGAFSREE